MIPNQKLECLSLIRYMLEYSYLFPQSILATYWAQYEANLRQALSVAEAFYRVEVPLKYDTKTLEQIGNLMA